MPTINNRKYIGSGEDVVLSDSGPYVPSEDEGVGLAVEGRDYQQTEEEACCFETGE